MDLGFYLGELLMQMGEVSVPGLGYFALERMSAYYDENEGKFHPPYHQAQFNTQLIDDDDALTVYIARKKNISIASAKYFSEKYITALKQAALTGEVPIGNLGWFYTAHEQLAFKPAKTITDDAAFYGFEPIKINKAETPEPALVQPADVVPEESDDNEAVPEYFDDEEQEKKPLRTLLIIFTVIVVLGIAAFALYRYQPATFEKVAFWNHKVVVTDTIKSKTVPVADSVKADTVKTDSSGVAKDTLTRTGTIDSLKTSRFEVIAASCTNMEEANTVIKNLKSIGLDAKIVTDAPGRRKKVSVGTYKTQKEAKDAVAKLIAARRIRADAYSIEIKPKQ